MLDAMYLGWFLKHFVVAESVFVTKGALTYVNIRIRFVLP